jgi:hypothetical protein
VSDLESLLRALRAEALDLAAAPPGRGDAHSFMMTLIDLGLLLEPGQSQPAEVRAFLDETASQLDRALGSITRFVMDTVSRGETGWSDDPTQWEDMCNRRSAIAYFVELYSTTALARALPGIDGGYLDNLMRAHANEGYLTADQIPEHMPTRHWWWWLPRTPPA